jgi:hypothetical protein
MKILRCTRLHLIKQYELVFLEAERVVGLFKKTGSLLKK